MEFGEPLALLLLVSVIAIGVLYIKYQRKRKDAILKFSSIALIKNAKPKHPTIRKHIPFFLLLLATIFIIIGLADPQVPMKTIKEGVNVVLAIDVSGSMAATDYSPTRLEAAKNAAETLIRSLKSEDNVGVVVFESGASTVAYLSPFKKRVIKKLRKIEQSEGKTALGDGLTLAIDMANSIPNKKKVVILLSDGVNNAGMNTVGEAIEYAKINRIQVYTIGLGSKNPTIIGYDIFGDPQYAELDEETLKNIAEKTGGKYYKSVNKTTLNEIYKNIGKNIERALENVSIKDWFFVFALALLFINFYIIYGKYRIIA